MERPNMLQFAEKIGMMWNSNLEEATKVRSKDLNVLDDRLVLSRECMSDL